MSASGAGARTLAPLSSRSWAASPKWSTCPWVTRICATSDRPTPASESPAFKASQAPGAFGPGSTTGMGAALLGGGAPPALCPFLPRLEDDERLHGLAAVLVLQADHRRLLDGRV